MELTFLHLAEYANTTEDRKLNVMGIFSNINAQNFPATHPQMYLIAQLTAKASEYGRNFKLTVKLLDEDATNEVISFSAPATVPTTNNGLPVSMNFTLRLVNTVFPKPGTYEFSVLVNDDEKGTLPLEVIQLSQPSL